MGGRSPVARTFLHAATPISTAWIAPTKAAACHGGSSSTAAKKTALATLTLTLRLMWRGNSSARIPAAARDATSHHSTPPAPSRGAAAAQTASEATPTASRKTSERRLAVMSRLRA